MVLTICVTYLCTEVEQARTIGVRAVMSNQPQHTDEEYTQDKEAQRMRVRCANCDIEVLWWPVVVEGVAYCCTGCAVGGPCNCDYSQYRSIHIAGVIQY